MSLLINSTHEDYHADRTALSSSNLKQILKDPAKFYNEWVLGNKEPEEENSAFTEGTFTHSLILEPEKINEYVIYPGLRKAGAAWEAFKLANKGKKILSAVQSQRCETYYKSYSNVSAATNLITGGVAEHTMLSSILDVNLKSRADYINLNDNYIVDVKTTSYGSDKESFKEVIQQYSYDLSAALYCQIAFNNYGRLFDFYFIVISKTDLTCDVYKASSETLSNGAAKMTKALVLYKKCKDSGIWQLDQPKKDFSDISYNIEEV